MLVDGRVIGFTVLIHVTMANEAIRLCHLGGNAERPFAGVEVNHEPSPILRWPIEGSFLPMVSFAPAVCATREIVFRAAGATANALPASIGDMLQLEANVRGGDRFGVAPAQ